MAAHTALTAQMRLSATLQPAPVTSGLVLMARVFHKRSDVINAMTVLTTLMSITVQVAVARSGHVWIGLAYPWRIIVMADMTVWTAQMRRTV